ncbi:MAG: hypothetical protein E6K56_02795 [Ignavibacteria bacterium]|nr:MAG: hypothetical protein E6K56_02795 [Ignavibacteria bacterium]
MTVKQLSKNAISIILSDAGRRVLGFFTIALLARRLAPSDFGLITIGFTVLSYATMLAAGGLGAIGIRAVARGESSLEGSSVIGARLVNSIIAFLLIGVSLIFIANRLTTILVLCFSVSLIPNAFLLDWYFQGTRRTFCTLVRRPLMGCGCCSSG